MIFYIFMYKYKLSICWICNATKLLTISVVYENIVKHKKAIKHNKPDQIQPNLIIYNKPIVR